jgi:hypothetical protein
MSQNIYFFEIPIYRVTQKHYGKETEITKVNVLKPIRDVWSRGSSEPAETSEIYQQEKYRFEEDYGTHTWRYNQAIGWLRLFTSDHSHIRADYYWVKERITKNLKNKHFRYRGEIKTFELDIFPGMSSYDIYTLLQEHIKELMEEKPFKEKYIDLEMFQNIGRCIDWRALLEA